MKTILETLVVQRRVNFGSGWNPQWERNVVRRWGANQGRVGVIFNNEYADDSDKYRLAIRFPDGDRDVWNRLSPGGGFGTIKACKQAIADYYEGDLRFIKVSNRSI